MKEIQLTKGYVAMVDDEDFEMVNQFKWQASVCQKTVYAKRGFKLENGVMVTQGMHRLIMGITDPKIQVDHKNHDGLDNRRQNLRIATNGQNQWNQRMPINNTTGYKGVSLIKKTGKYIASSKVNGQFLCLGYFDCKEEAARHYNQCARDNGQGFELLNDVEPLFPTTERVTRAEREGLIAAEKLERIKKHLLDLEKGCSQVNHIGVTFDMQHGKWRATLNKKYIGIYLTQKEAIEAIKSHKTVDAPTC